MKIDLYNDDCIKKMDKLIADGVIVDAIITDPPYGTTACKWDSVIPFDEMWIRLDKLIKPNGAIVLFGSEPFSSQLRCSNIKNYKYDWVWDKTSISNPQLAKYQPLKQHETISVFSKGTHNYYPQGLKSTGNKKKQSYGHTGDNLGNEKLGHINRRKDYIQEYTNYPKSILKFNRPSNPVHPTQKPVVLMEYLIKTYTDENGTVLDFTMGSGSTMVACINTKRNGIGIELDREKTKGLSDNQSYFDISVERVKKANNDLGLFKIKDLKINIFQ